jgi:hypothetical protein
LWQHFRPWAKANLVGWVASGDAWFEVERSTDSRRVKFLVPDAEWSDFVRSVQSDYVPRPNVDHQLFNTINDRIYGSLYGGVKCFDSYVLFDGDFWPVHGMG